MTVILAMHQGNPIGVELPAAVELEVTYAEPAVKGNTVSGATKLVTVETGLEVQVPLFVEQGDRIKVDTRSGEYLTRV
jgi:elongation factor P